MRLLWKTTCAGLWVGSGIAAEWITASWPRTTAKAAPASVRSVCTYAASAGSGRSNTGAPRSVEVTSCPAARRASTVARPTLPRPPVTRMRMARNLLAARAVSAGPQPVAGGSCRRITLLRLRRLRLRTCPPPPARAASLPGWAPPPASRSASVYSFAAAAPAPGSCAAALRRSIAPPWSASALANDGRPRQAGAPIGEHTCNRPAHGLPLLISRCIGVRSRRERPSRRPVQIRPPNIGTRLAAAACGSCVTRRARRIVCLWAALRCRSSMRAVASARLRWCIGLPIRTRICLSRVLTRPAGETRRRISSISGVAVGVSRDARLRS